MRIGVLIEASMDSRDCPGRPLLPLGPRNVLGHSIRRVLQSARISGLAIVTSSQRPDDDVADFCGLNHIRCFRRPDQQRLQGLALALEHLPWDAIVRVPESSSLIDPIVIDDAIERFATEPAEAACTWFANDLPAGQRIEVLDSRQLRDTARRYATRVQREDDTSDIDGHLCNVLQSTRPVEIPVTYHGPMTSTGIETIDDLERMRMLYQNVGTRMFDWSWQQLCAAMTSLVAPLASETRRQAA